MSALELTVSELLRLPNLAARWRGSSVPPAKYIAGVSTDSRTVQFDELFFAIKGDVFDGHDFVEQALQKNALAFVVDQAWYDAHGANFGNAPIITVADTLHAFQEFARYYRKKFTTPVVALSGSSGKTTTKEAIYTVLSQKFNVLRNRKSFNNHIGVPATLYELRKEHEILLIELGTNHFGELERLSYLAEPNVCLLTNIGHAHLEFFKSLEGVAKAKMEIFAHAQSLATSIYNNDDSVLARQIFPTKEKISFGLMEGSQVRGKIKSCDALARYKFELLGKTINLPVSGRHNVYNALAAAAVGQHFSMSIKEIKSGLENLQPVDNRMQVLKINSLTIIDDCYNSNPSSCAAAIASLADMKIKRRGRRVVVLGDMLELGEFSVQEHEKQATVIAESKTDALFLFGQATEFTAKRAEHLGVPTVAHFTDKDALHQRLNNFLHPHVLVLIKGSRGMRMETVVKSVKEFFAKQTAKNR